MLNWIPRPETLKEKMDLEKKKINVTAGPEFWHQRNGAK